MDATERIPDAVVRIVVRLVAFPQWILAGVILRRESCSIQAGPEDGLQAFVGAAGLDGYYTEIFGPGLSCCCMNGVKVEVRDLALGIRASLVDRDETHSDTGEDFGGGMEARPSSGGQNGWRIVDPVLHYSEILWLAAGAVVHEYTRVANLTAGEVGAEMESVRSDAEAGAESTCARDAAGVFVYGDGAIDSGVWKICQVRENQRA